MLGFVANLEQASKVCYRRRRKTSTEGKKKANPFKSCHAIIDLAESGFKS